jgi:hypothetical protein
VLHLLNGRTVRGGANLLRRRPGRGRPVFAVAFAQLHAPTT